MGALPAVYYGWLLSWARAPLVETYRRFVSRIAYAWRYGRGGTLYEILNLPTDFVDDLGRALSKIVDEENKPKGG